jgi:hypothetical protein
LENFKKIRDNIGSAEARIKEVQAQRAALEQQQGVLARIHASLEDGATATIHTPAGEKKQPALVQRKR